MLAARASGVARSLLIAGFCGCGLLSHASESTDTPRHFREYLATAPACEVTVERNFAGHVEYVRVRRQGDALTLFKGRLEPPPHRLTSNQLATVVHLCGTNSWSIRSTESGVNVVYYDSIVRERTVAAFLAEALQVLNMGAAIPPRALRGDATHIDYLDTFANASRHNSISLAVDAAGAVIGLTNHMVSGTNMVVHSFAYEYVASTTHVAWLPSRSVLTIRPAGRPEVRNAGSWRQIKATILSSHTTGAIVDPKDCLVEGSVVNMFYTKDGNTYKLVEGKAIRADTLGRPEVTTLSRVVYLLGAGTIAAISVTLVVIGRKEPQGTHHNDK